MQLADPIDLERKNIAKIATLKKWRISGVGPRFVKVGRFVKYDWRDVEEWLQSRKANSTSEAT